MDVTTFWKLIDTSRRGAKSDPEAHAETLQTALARLPPAQIVAFYRLLNHHWVKAYTWNLWAAAYTITDGCSDDGFMYFRCWLVFEGSTGV